MKVGVCTDPDCGAIVSGGGRCETHRLEARRAADRRRPNAAARGYDATWAKRRAEFLRWFSVCVDCGEPATVADHDPVSRAELVRRGVPDPDAWGYLRPRCERCHNRRTVREDGGFGRHHQRDVA